MSFYATVAIGVCILCSFETVRQISQVFKLIEHLDDFIEKSERKNKEKLQEIDFSNLFFNVNFLFLLNRISQTGFNGHNP